MSDVLMPKLSDSMQEGTIVRWLVEDGAEITQGQEIAEVETDKATVPVEADASGILRRSAHEGDTVPVGQPIAQLLAPGGSPAPLELAGVAGSASGGGNRGAGATSRSVSSSPPEPWYVSSSTRASPLARRVAHRLGIPIGPIQGSGPGGRILKADVVAHHRATSPAPAGQADSPRSDGVASSPANTVPSAPSGNESASRIETAKGASRRSAFTRSQQTVARRMAEAKATIPEFALHVRIDMEACWALRDDLKAAQIEPDAPLPSFNDLIIKACATALRRHPRANASYNEGELELHPRVNVGFAVATPDSLLVPTIFDADTKSVAQIATESRVLAQLARDGKISPAQLAGGTFTASNLGMFGIEAFTAIINPPQVAILAAGAIERVPVIVGDTVAARWQMAATLTCDHRVLYGAQAAQFLGDIKRHLEHPALLL